MQTGDEGGCFAHCKFPKRRWRISYYRVELNSDGDVASIFDKTVGKELLSAPARLAISYDNPQQWPAWNMDWDQEQAAPKSYVGGPATIRKLSKTARCVWRLKFPGKLRVPDSFKQSVFRPAMPGSAWSLAINGLEHAGIQFEGVHSR